MVFLAGPLGGWTWPLCCHTTYRFRGSSSPTIRERGDSSGPGRGGCSSWTGTTSCYWSRPFTSLVGGFVGSGFPSGHSPIGPSISPAPNSGWAVDKILKGQFIEFKELLSDNVALLLNLGSWGPWDPLLVPGPA